MLMYLQDIKYILHDEGFGFDLIFTFEKNDHFTNETLKKSFVPISTDTATSSRRPSSALSSLGDQMVDEMEFT